MKNKSLTIVLVAVIIILLGYIAFKPKPTLVPHVPAETLQEGEDKNIEQATTPEKDTYTYTNHGFSIELPKGFVPQKIIEGEGYGPENALSLPHGGVAYVTDTSYWEKNVLTSNDFIKNEKIGDTIFKIYNNKDGTYYWFKQGKVGYEFFSVDKDLLKTFKYIGWPQIEGNKEDLVSFSIKPGQEVSGKMKVTGAISGLYYFEGSFPVQILDANKNKTSYGPGFATTEVDSMTSKPIPFSADFDFSVIPKGKYFIKLMQDDPRGESGMGEYTSRSVLVPIVVK